MKSNVGNRKSTRQYRIVGWRQCSFQSAMKCDADINKSLCADIVLTGGGNVSFQSVTNCDADTPENLYAVVPWSLPRITVRGGTLVRGGVSLQTLDTCSPQDLQQE